MRQVSVVLGSYNRFSFLKNTIDTIRVELSGTPHELIVVDGGSTDGSLRYLARQKDVITIIQHNRGAWRGKPLERRSWGYFMNLGFRAASGKYICMVSDDCLVIPGAIGNGIRLFEAKLAEGRKVGAVAFYWREWPGENYYRVGLTFGDKMFVNHGLYLRAALEEVGFIDEDKYRFYHADSDLSLRMAEKGYACIDSPNSFIEHCRHVDYWVRKGNNAYPSDWENSRERWEKLGIPSSNWIKRPYLDPYKTVEKYWKTNQIRIKVNIFEFLRFCKRRLVSRFGSDSDSSS